MYGSWLNQKEIFIIAEIGINHNGDIKIAKKLIDLAVNSGCNAVKFQKRKIDKVYTKEFLSSPRESPWGSTQRDQKEGLEFSLSDYEKIDSYCKEVGIEWFFSAWDVESQIEMRRFGCKFNKLASAMATNSLLVEEVAKEKKPTFLSTGMMDLDEIKSSIDLFKKHNCMVMLMHTVSLYPAPDEVLNLNCIKTLKDKFELPVGYSGHESTVSPSLIATCLGAQVIERHISLDRAMYGSDQAASLGPEGIRSLVNQIRKYEKVIGDGEKVILPDEENVAKKLRYWI